MDDPFQSPLPFTGDKQEYRISAPAELRTSPTPPPRTVSSSNDKRTGKRVSSNANSLSRIPVARKPTKKQEQEAVKDMPDDWPLPAHYGQDQLPSPPLPQEPHERPPSPHPLACVGDALGARRGLPPASTDYTGSPIQRHASSSAATHSSPDPDRAPNVYSLVPSIYVQRPSVDTNHLGREEQPPKPTGLRRKDTRLSDIIDTGKMDHSKDEKPFLTTNQKIGQWFKKAGKKMKGGFGKGNKDGEKKE